MRSRWLRTSTISVMLLVCSWLAYAQTSKRTSGSSTKTAATATTAAALSQRVEAQRAVLLGNERKRIERLDDLEFTPRPRPGGKPFPMLCLIPPATDPASIDPHRSLFVHDRGTLDGADFTLQRTLSEIASDVTSFVPGTNAVSIFRQLWDTQAAAPGLVASSPHCTDNGSTINGFPITCPRAERNEAAGSDAQITARMAEYAPLALVNRIEFAQDGWANCGEYRMIYGRRGSGIEKNTIIFEAVLPNPKPGCREGCLPVAQFWRNLSTIDSAATRATQLANFFYNGLPGFRPVVHVDHYSAKGVTGGYGGSGSGQIRTNQFLQSPWTLKEFKTVINCGTRPCTFNLVPIMVKVNPQGNLWNESDPHPLGANFRAQTLAQLARLSSHEMMKIGYEVDLKHDAGQSVSQPPATIDNYRLQMNLASASGFRAALGAGSLSADQVANRALTQSCAGCHQPSTFGLNASGSIGSVTTPTGGVTDSWPAPVPAGFVHVDVLPASTLPEFSNAAVYGTGQGQVISQALHDFFLPERKNFLVGYLDQIRCGCPPRFKFLPPERRAKAFTIEERVHRRFAERLETLERRQLELEAAASSIRERSNIANMVAREHAALVDERETALAEELRKEGIQLPDAQKLDLRAQPMNLRVAGNVPALVREVNAMLRQEPPRRTVTGSFRSH